MTGRSRLERVRGRLHGVRGTFRRLFFLDGFSWTVLAVVGFLVATFALDYLLDLPRGVRLTFLAAGGAWVAVLVGRKILYRMVVPIPDDDLALIVERRYPQLEDRLISAMQFSRRRPDDDPDASPELVEHLIEEAAEASEPLDFEQVVLRRPVRTIAMWAAAASLLMAVAAFSDTELSSIYFQRLVGGKVRWPRLVRLEVPDFDENNTLVVARGDDLVVSAVARRLREGASLPDEAVMYYEYESGERGKRDMTCPVAGSFHSDFPSLTGPFRFRIRGGGDETDDHYVKTRNRPGLAEIQIFFRYPGYLKRTDTPPDRPEVNGNIDEPMHTEVRFVARVSEDLESAEMLIGPRGQQQRRELEVQVDASDAPRKVAGSFEVAWPQADYQLIFRGKNKLSNETRSPIRFTIRGRVDRPPNILVNDPVGNEEISEVCVRPFDLVVADDFGVKETGFEYKLTGHRSVDWTYIPFTAKDNQGAEYGEKSVHTLFAPGFDVAKLGVKPGDFLHVRFRASDYKDIGQRNVSVSKEYRFEVVSLTKLQQRLEKDIENIKTELDKTRRHEETVYGNVGGFREGPWVEKDLLDSREAGEVRESSLEQNRVTSRLDRARRDVERVRRRGVYNRVFEQEHAKDLVSAEKALEALVGTQEKPGPSPLASGFLQEAAKVRTRAPRRTAFGEAQNMQAVVIAGIRDAISFLERWSTYQEVIRKAREIHEKQGRVNEDIKGSGKGEKKEEDEKK